MNNSIELAVAGASALVAAFTALMAWKTSDMAKATAELAKGTNRLGDVTTAGLEKTMHAPAFVYALQLLQDPLARSEREALFRFVQQGAGASISFEEADQAARAAFSRYNAVAFMEHEAMIPPTVFERWGPSAVRLWAAGEPFYQVWRKREEMENVDPLFDYFQKAARALAEEYGIESDPVALRARFFPNADSLSVAEPNPDQPT